VVSTHGNLLALILNGLDSAFGYDFWWQLSFPDIYRLTFEGTAMTRVERIWDQAA
jgi:2,3-bisphosphoglycerate-dependent phosphoglycerate mutase